MPRHIPGKLTAKQERFVREYLVDLNGTQAAIRAGYSKQTARAIASEMLTKPYIATAIETGLRDEASRVKVTKEWITETITVGLVAATKERNYPGMGRLGELLSKLGGHITEKRDVRFIRRVEDLSDEELAALAQTQADQSEATRH